MIHVFNQEPPDPGPSLPEEAGAGEVQVPKFSRWRRDVLPGDLGPLLAHTQGDLRPGVSSQVLVSTIFYSNFHNIRRRRLLIIECFYKSFYT